MLFSGCCRVISIFCERTETIGFSILMPSKLHWEDRIDSSHWSDHWHCHTPGLRRMAVLCASKICLLVRSQEIRLQRRACCYNLLTFWLTLCLPLPTCDCLATWESELHRMNYVSRIFRVLCRRARLSHAQNSIFIGPSVESRVT